MFCLFLFLYSVVRPLNVEYMPSIFPFVVVEKVVGKFFFSFLHYCKTFM